MTTAGTRQIAAERQRERIPTDWLIEFDTWTNEALGSLAEDPKVTSRTKVYAGWELEYREAFGFEVYYGGEKGTELKRRQV